MSDRNTEEHKKLASVLKSVHADLRKKLRESNGDFDAVWTQHCQDQNLLSVYAQSMKALAQKHWTKKPQTRIDWCYDTIKDYFYHGGLQKVLQKEQKRQLQEKRLKSEKLDNKGKKVECYFQHSCSNEWTSREVQPEQNAQNPQCGETERNKQEETLDRKNNSSQSNTSSLQSTFNAGSDSKKGRIRLLDVGSCYNPFLAFEEFLAVGVDISPACETVHLCDFLHVTIEDSQEKNIDEHGEAMMEKYLQSLTSPVHVLPAHSFHVVVFSLLLEYLPARFQRWLCCVQAHQLLQTHGLLVIITPDSHSQHRNAPMIRSWSAAIEALGFRRWRYVKQEHLHCMAFRKLDHEDRTTPISRSRTIPCPYCLDDPKTATQQATELPAFSHFSPTLNPASDKEMPESSGNCHPKYQCACVVKFSEMMYIPQDFSDEASHEGDRAGGGKLDQEFRGEEDRQRFFSLAESELPSFLSEED